MKTKKIKFKNKEDITLSADLNLPVDRIPKAYAVFAHCFTCNKNFHGPRNISQRLTANGFAVLLFDFTGLGESEGSFQSTNFSTNIQDLCAANEYLSKHYEAPKIMIGHSLGGLAALFAAKQLKNIEALVTIAAPFEATHIKKLLSEDIEKIKKEGKAEVNIGGRPFTVNKRFLEDIDQHHSSSIAEALRRPILIMHSPQDNIVSIDNAAEIYEAAMHPKSFISLDGADHLLQNIEDSKYVGEVISSWAMRYIKTTEKEEQPADNETIAQTNQDSFQTEIRTGIHRLIADEPEEVGGTNLGPSPHQMLSAALAACSTMTMQMYAKRKKWPLELATASVKHKKVERKADQKKIKVDRFERLVELKGDLDEEQRKRLLEIANKCPVKRTLDSANEIDSSLKS